MNDKDRVELARKEYDDLQLNSKIDLNGGETTVGRVSQVNDKPTGEQSFVVTDKYCPTSASIEQRNQVKEVTVIYRGSSFELSSDVAKNWLLNDIPTEIQ